ATCSAAFWGGRRRAATFVRRLQTEAVEGALDRPRIGGVPVADMHQQRIDVVDVATQLEEARIERRQLPVAPEEGRAEGVEQRGEGQLDLRMADIDGRVD